MLPLLSHFRISEQSEYGAAIVKAESCRLLLAHFSIHSSEYRPIPPHLSNHIDITARRLNDASPKQKKKARVPIIKESRQVDATGFEPAAKSADGRLEITGG